MGVPIAYQLSTLEFKGIDDLCVSSYKAATLVATSGQLYGTHVGKRSLIVNLHVLHC